MAKALFVLPLLVGLAAGGAVDLTEDNFDQEVSDSGKAAFIKFLAPWWGHCKSMKPAWDQLGDSFKDSKTVLIGDVDCTVEKDLCSKFGVRGYPTIKYFTGATAAEGDSYDGKRDFDSLKAFADENLGPSCGAGENLELCTDEQKAVIEEASALSIEEIDAFIQGKVDEMDEAEKYLKDEVQKLQERYQELNKEKDEKIKALSPNLRLYRSVKSHKASGAGAKDEL